MVVPLSEGPRNSTSGLMGSIPRVGCAEPPTTVGIRVVGRLVGLAVGSSLGW